MASVVGQGQHAAHATDGKAAGSAGAGGAGLAAALLVARLSLDITIAALQYTMVVDVSLERGWNTEQQAAWQVLELSPSQIWVMPAWPGMPGFLHCSIDLVTQVTHWATAILAATNKQPGRPFWQPQGRARRAAFAHTHLKATVTHALGFALVFAVWSSQAIAAVGQDGGIQTTRTLGVTDPAWALPECLA